MTNVIREVKYGKPTGRPCHWGTEFLEAAKERLVCDTERRADKREPNAMPQEMVEPKQAAAELPLENRLPAAGLGLRWQEVSWVPGLSTEAQGEGATNHVL